MSEENDRQVAEFQYLKASLMPRLVTCAISREPVEGKQCLYCEVGSIHEAHGFFRSPAEAGFTVLFNVCVLCGQPYRI